MAEMLWNMAPATYFEAGVPQHLLAGEVPGLDLAESARWVSQVRTHCPRFFDSLLRLYHTVFLTPRLARAAMVAAAGRISPVDILALAEGAAPTGGPLSEADAAAADFLGAILPRLPPDELVRGAIEVACMRRLQGDRNCTRILGDWAVRHAVGEATAFHYIMFAGDTYPSRHAPDVARDIAVQMLRATGKDHVDHLLSLADTDCSETLRGLAHAFGSLREERAVPFLADRLKDSRKMQRVPVIRALGKIGTPAAIAAIRSVAGDKRKVVRQAIEKALGNQPPVDA
jgi:hypothetical protein